jgi:hypothetical protein
MEKKLKKVTIFKKKVRFFLSLYHNFGQPSKKLLLHVSTAHPQPVYLIYNTKAGYPGFQSGTRSLDIRIRVSWFYSFLLAFPKIRVSRPPDPV